MTIRKSRYGRSCLVGVSLALATVSAFANDLGRDDEAVVLPGNADPSLVGMAPERVAAYRWDGRWTRVPVQVDERAIVDFATIYGDPVPSGYTVLTYTDPGTFTGPDPDPLVDADDEVVFLVREAGARAPAGAGVPQGVVPGSGIELTLAHPGGGGATAWVYLFLSDASLPVLPPSPDVVYDFVLLSGDYKTTYDTGGVGDVGNPEASTVTTPSYRVGFSDRWMRVDTGILRGGAPGTDILERHRDRFGPDICSRTEWTFSMGEGAFLVNKNGPVRALRGYVGANSGVTTYRVHLFYPSTEVIRTVLRVHSIPGLIDFFDWDVAAAGMTWRNDLNPQGVPVDGEPDAVASGPFLWESLAGPQGSIAMVPILDTDIPGFAWTSWYADSVPAAAGPCPDQGDDNRQYGASGFWRAGGVANTDPAVPGDSYHLSLTRTLRFLGPNAPATAGSDLRDEIDRPLTVAFSAYLPSTACAEGDGDGWAVCVEGCEPASGISCGDCEDGDPGVHPGADERCNLRDDDCDGLIDEGLPETAWYLDADGDRWGDPADAAITCDVSAPVGRVARAGDCDDADAGRNPDATEICDGLDQDCDGAADDGLAFRTWYRDRDGDGYGDRDDTAATCDGQPPSGYVASDGDCDDSDSGRNPGAAESCNDRDDDCDGVVDDGLVFLVWYRDADGDGYGAASSTTSTCDGAPPDGYAARFGDCDDTLAAVFPGAAETCNGVDDDCDGVVDEDVPGCGSADCRDDDRDGWAVCGDGCAPPVGVACGDCDDGDPLRHPGAVEACNGRDENCDGVADDGLPRTTWFADGDGDGAGRDTATETTCDGAAPAGYAAEGGDCDDADASVYPGAMETCDGIDNDCASATADGSSEPWIGGACDGDDADSCSSGAAICSGGTRACDDDPASSVDVCDGSDNDCDAIADNPECRAFDLDGNGRVDGLELAWVGRAFGSCLAGAESAWWTRVDFNGDGCVDGDDLVILANLWARACVDGTLCR